jgi:hypothetical protein
MAQPTYSQLELIESLGLIDNLHDGLDSKLAKAPELQAFFSSYRKFYLQHTNIKNNSFIKNTPELSFLVNESQQFKNPNTSKVQGVYFSDIMKDAIKKAYPRVGITLAAIQQHIVDNFNRIFDISGDDMESILLARYKSIKQIGATNINMTLSDDKKIKLRQPLYFLIKTKDDKLIKFFLDYMGLGILSSNIKKFIINKIKFNITKFIASKHTNYLYPSTYFDDMSNGITPEYNMRFKIINKDKSNIDMADTEGEKSYLDHSLSKFYLSHFTINDTTHSMGFSLDETTDRLEYMGVKYYMEGGILVCEYNGITIRVKKNQVGRTGYGLYQSIISLTKLLDMILQRLPYNQMTEQPNLDEIIDTGDLESLLRTIVTTFVTRDLCIGFIIFILFGAKRFGDWIQADLAKKHYFMIQTVDKYFILYAYLTGAPIVLDGMLYNYDPSGLTKDINFNLFQKFDPMGNYTTIQPQSQFIFTDIKEVKVDEINRWYFEKYKKYEDSKAIPLEQVFHKKYLLYKKKYLKLKNLLSNKLIN